MVRKCRTTGNQHLGDVFFLFLSRFVDFQQALWEEQKSGGCEKDLGYGFHFFGGDFNLRVWCLVLGNGRILVG